MDRVAVFVDAGYLFAQGSKLLTGRQEPPRRSDLSLKDPNKVIERLSAVAAEKAKYCSLLRIYWYDGGIEGRLSIEQEKLAQLDNVKIRLGSINQDREQKEVDSLIVTDLMELARLGAICDAILMSGDADIRVGVLLAQNYGVRVHLVGLADAQGNSSQSKSLRQEADTTTIWNRNLVEEFLEVREGRAATATPVESTGPSAFDPTLLDQTVEEAIARLTETDLTNLVQYFEEVKWGLPPEFDRPLLAACTKRIGTELSTPQKRHMRGKFRSAVLAKAGI